MDLAFASRLPLGEAITDKEFNHRHKIIVIVLALHTPVLFIVGLLNGYALWHSALESLPAVVLALFAHSGANRLIKSAVASVGLAIAASILVHFTGGLVESHFHWFVILSLGALYIDVRPFIAAIGYILVHHVTMSAYDPTLVFSHVAGQQNPLLWTAIHVAFVLMLIGSISINWLTMDEHAEEGRLMQRSKEHELRHRAMVASDATSRTVELRTFSVSARQSMADAGDLVDSINSGTAEVGRLVAEVASLAQEADTMSTETKQTIEHLAEQSNAIAGLVEVIDDIADRTNLLALNASIEAARAGEAGKGFAVVAQEVKELAATTGSATEQIAHLTVQVRSKMDDANSRMAEVSETIRSIAELQREVDTAMEEQSSASSEMRTQVLDASQEVNQIIEGISDLNELMEEDAVEDPAIAFNAIHGT